MKKYTLIGIIVLVAGLIYTVTFFTHQKKETLISYNRDIRPVLSDKCFACHGPDVSKVKAGLRLDLPSSAFAELEKNKGHFAIVPGNPDKSELIKRVSSNDPAIMMPIPESHLARLTTDEIKLFKKWIEQGAKYEKHWAFVAPVKAPLPEVSNSKWVKNEIDPFILEKMEAKGFSPNEPASKEVLIKRAFVDITGLAPSYAQLEQWRNNNNDNWYSQLLDNLLQKPAYGEKMALLWMDLARYADSYGFQDDNIRSQWPWRDWVINAFNSNMHYDQFLTQQIAGDLLPNANKSTILATAFFRNHKYTEEGGVIDEEYRVSYNIDKTRTYGKAILGVTIECAQCHDHKYDPFSNKDYYQLYAFFNMSKEKGYEGDVSVSTPAKNPKLFITKEEQTKFLSFINHADTNKLEVSVMGDWKIGDTVKARPTYILSRGRYDAPTTTEVKPTALESIMPFDTLKFSTEEKLVIYNKIMKNYDIDKNLSYEDIKLRIEFNYKDIKIIKVDNIFELAIQCLDQVYEGDEVQDVKTYTKKELMEFLESMKSDQFLKLQEFFSNMPKLEHDIEVENPKTGVKNTVKLEGLGAFFA